MQWAVQLLNTTDLSIKRISDQLGFSDQFYFSRAFTKNSGRQTERGGGGPSVPPPKTLKKKVFYTAAVLILLGLFCAATWVRNERVVQCGETVHRILSSLPKNLLADGTWKLSFANFPGEQVSRRYGFYGFRGTDTIGDGVMADLTIESALQLIFKNELLTGKVVKAEELIAICESDVSSRHLCLWVHSDGRVEQLQR